MRETRYILVAMALAGVALAAGCCLLNSPPQAVVHLSSQRGSPPLLVTFDASESADSGGKIVEYRWDFGDGAGGTGLVVTHTYLSAGNFTATLIVRDRCGLESQAQAVIQVISGLPIAQFSFDPTDPEAGQLITFDASNSYDPDGEIIGYLWEFGDGTYGAGERSSHAYEQAGEYHVRLLVSDDDGNTASKTTVVTVAEANSPPIAAFVYSPKDPSAGRPVEFDASASYDPDGEIAAYRWALGDGGTGEGVVVTHAYQDPGRYRVTLTVEDTEGATGQHSKNVDVQQAPLNRSPVADAGPSRTVRVGERVRLDATGSSDPDGDPLTYSWVILFRPGDSQAALEDAHLATPSFIADKSGEYLVQLEVSDGGLSDKDVVQVVAVGTATIFVDVASGDDQKGDGTTGSPFRTITRALKQADSIPGKNVVRVRPGIYETGRGEDFPLLLAHVELVGDPSNPSGVKVGGETILGASSSIRGCHLLGTINVAVEGLIEIRDNRLTPHTGPSIEVRSTSTDAGEVEIIGNSMASEGSGIYLQSAKVTIRNNTIRECGTGINVHEGYVLIESNVIENCLHGIWIGGDAYAELESNHIYGKGFGFGIDVFSIQRDIAEVKLQYNTVKKHYTGIRVEGLAILDAGGGVFGSVGANLIVGNLAYNLSDERLSDGGPLYAVGNTWDDPQPRGQLNGPADTPPNARIAKQGNQIKFSQS